MNRLFGLLGALGLVAGVFAANTAFAAGPDDPVARADRAKPTLVAVAIGQVREGDDEVVTVDLRATQRGGKSGGNLRFYSEDDGYYNGAVRQLSVEGNVVKAAGAGALTKPDGTRAAVRFQATIRIDTKAITITVEGRKTEAYTIDGTLSGLVRAGTPEPKPARTAQ